MQVPEIRTSESLKSTHVRQVAPTELQHMVEKVEMNVAMLTADIEERAHVDECRLSVDNELSDLRRATASDGERDRVKSYLSESRAGGPVVCVTHLGHREHDDSQLYRPQQACW